MENPNNGKATLNDFFNRFEIIIPAKKNWFAIIFLGTWLGGWLMGELLVIIVLTEPLGGSPGFASISLIWLCGWTLGGVFTIKTFLWNLLGKEIITLENGQLTIAKKWLLFSKPATYHLRDIKKIRATADEENILGGFLGTINNFNSFNTINGSIRFNYGMQTVAFGSGIDEAEANYILNKLKSKKFLKDENY